MTILDPHLDIDQVSAAVDGERDPAAAAHLLVCLACREQVEAWRRALAPLREPPEAPGDVDQVIEEALAAWDPPAALPVPDRLRPSSSPVPGRPLSRPGAARRPFRLPPPVAAALIITVLLAVVVSGLHFLAGGSTTSSAVKTSGGIAAGSAATGRSTAAPARGPRAPAPAVIPSLAFSGTSQLAAQLRRDVPAGTGAAARGPCLRQAVLLAARNPAVRVTSPSFSESVLLAGVDGQVFVFAGVHGDVAVVVRPDTCSLLATVLL